YLPCQNDFVNDEGYVQLPKEWSTSSGKNISGVSMGFLPVFKNDSELMNQFVYLHALTQKIAMFYVIFHNFSGLTLDCRYVIKEMNEAIQHYKSLHLMWLKNIQGLYEKAESYLVEAKKNQNVKEVENWKYHFSQVRNIYQKLTDNLQSLSHLVYDFEKVLCNSEPVMPLNEAKAALEKPLAIMRYFTGSLIKSQVSPSSAGESLSFTPPRSAPGSRIGTPK
ncbi:MAG: hypothetical protein SFW07_07785, partial [Gammaproteobacteria bacterium]|nr:hypothetical protein [Gammaproteobacteria bacterium]